MPVDFLVVGLGVATVSSLVASGWIWLQQREQQRDLDELASVVVRVAAGETEVTAPRMEGAAGKVSVAINAVADLMRKEKLGAYPERLFEQAMLRETPNGLFVVDGTGRIRSINPAALSLVPWRGEPLGQAAAAAVPLAELLDVLEDTASTRKITERSAQVGNKELLLRGLPLADGKSTLGVILDITSVRLAERARRDFVSNVSHELRTPITSILGYAEALIDEPLPESAKPMLDAIHRNAKRLANLTDDVLMLSKIEARGLDLPTEVIVLAKVIDEVAARLEATANNRGVKLSVDCPVELTIPVNVDAFEHALSNLVENALKYTAPGGFVRIEAASGPAGIEVAVVDNGMGIDPAHHPRIFERFYRVDVGRSRETGGTGLGLALVKHLVLAMGAEVSFTSAPGKGSRFVLRLPL